MVPGYSLFVFAILLVSAILPDAVANDRYSRRYKQQKLVGKYKDANDNWVELLVDVTLEWVYCTQKKKSSPGNDLRSSGFGRLYKIEGTSKNKACKNRGKCNWIEMDVSVAHIEKLFKCDTTES